MTMEYRFRADMNCALLFGKGRRSLQEYRDLVHALMKDKRIQPMYLRLADTRSAGPLPSAAFAQKTADIFNELNVIKPSKRAAILVSEPLDYGMMRMFQAHLTDEGDRLRPFQNFTEACQWLGLPANMPDPFAPERWQPEWSTDGK